MIITLALNDKRSELSAEGERQNEAQRIGMIIDYLQENAWKKAEGKDKKINKSDVMRHMEAVSRDMTTHKIITDLIREDKIIVKKDKPYSQTHYLDINNDNEFNKINQGIAGLFSDIAKLEIAKRHPTKEEKAVMDIYRQLRRIQRLPSKDSQVLYPKIIKVFTELAIKFVTAWGEASKEDKEDSKRRANERAAAYKKSKGK